jgi:hypothetical protein
MLIQISRKYILSKPTGMEIRRQLNLAYLKCPAFILCNAKGSALAMSFRDRDKHQKSAAHAMYQSNVRGNICRNFILLYCVGIIQYSGEIKR